MPSWSQFEAEAPELAREVRERLDEHTHKTIATLRRDGSPRISGTETRWADGELWIGSMWRALKALDLQRDPRFALHSGSEDPPGWKGDAKLAGRAEEVHEPARTEEMDGEAANGERSHSFRLDLDEVSAVSLNDDRTALVIKIWKPGEATRTIERA